MRGCLGKLMVWVKKLRELRVLRWFIKLWLESINICRWSKILPVSLRGSEGVCTDFNHFSEFYTL